MTVPKWMQPPADLGQSGAKHWNYYAQGLRAAGYLKPTSVQQFKTLCRYLAIIDGAMASIEADGAVIGTASGTRKANPGVAILLKTQPKVDSLMIHFGIWD